MKASRADPVGPVLFFGSPYPLHHVGLPAELLGVALNHQAGLPVARGMEYDAPGFADHDRSFCR